MTTEYRLRHTDGTSFRFQNSDFSEARATCCADPFSYRTFHFSRGLRRDRRLDKTIRPGGHNLLQLDCRSDFNIPGRYHRNSFMAVPVRGTEIKRHSFAAPGICLLIERADLDGLVAAL